MKPSHNSYFKSSLTSSLVYSSLIAYFKSLLLKVSLVTLLRLKAHEFLQCFYFFFDMIFFIQFRDKIDRHLTEKALGTNNRTKHVRQVNSRILFYKVDIHVFFSFFGRLVKRKQRSKVLFYDGYVEQILYRVCATLN